MWIMQKFIIRCSVGLVTALLFSVFSFSQVDVLTQHNDLARTGWNNQETILNTGNVNTNSFGLLFKRSLDDQPYAQPLVVTGVNIPGVGARNVMYACTVNNSVYAFDADDGSVGAYWQKNFSPSGYGPAHIDQMHPSLCGGGYNDFTYNIGIVGTPVIDKASNTIYFVTKLASTTAGVVDNHAYDHNVANEEYTYTTTGFLQFLHAVDLSTGTEKFGGPVQISATAAGTGDGSSGGVITFDPRRAFNRCGLVLSRGIVYIAFGGHCDFNPAHGWVLGYDAATLQQKMVYITTPNDGRGGIWMSGAAPAVDGSGNLYFTSGNAYDDGHTYFNSPSDIANRGESVVKLTPNAPDNTATALSVSSYFTPYNYQQLNDYDLDFPMQVMLVPNSNIALTGLKDNNLYVMDRNNLGGFNASSNNVLQIINVGTNAQMHSSFGYFGGATTQYVYQYSENTLLQSFQVSGNSLTNQTNSFISGAIGLSGGYMATSSNGSDASSAILWVSQANNCNANQQLCPGILHAVRADNVNTELWNSTLNPADDMGNFGKMSCPTVANGKVYLTSFSNQIVVYGLSNNNGCTSPNVSASANNSLAVYSASSTAGGSSPANAFDSNNSTAWTSNNGGTGGGSGAYITVDLGAAYNICKVILHWGTNYGTAYNIQGSNDGTNFTTLSSVTGNASADNVINLSNAGYRYIRMQGVTRQNINAGYDINEFEVYGTVANPCAAPSNPNATNITENTATLNWQGIPDATSYTIQYKSPIVTSWITRTTTSTSIDISALTCGTGYTFTVQATCASGAGSVATGTFNTATCSNPCSLPTRYFNADIGDIGVTGSSCYANGTFTIKGSGNSIGGNTDQFQYAFTSFAGDINIMAEVLTQDAVNANDKAGIMFRDSISNTSRFVFIGTTSGNGIVFMYRSTPGGPTTTITVAGLNAPYWVELVKSGTQYTAFISPTGAANSWVQVGTPVDLGFGSLSAYTGMAVSSADNSLLSTATIRDFAEVSAPLTVKLISFTATNIDNQYVALKWATDTEVNSKYFEVQRSSNGTDFTAVAQVNAMGNSTTIQNYTVNDYQPVNGVNYYRLKEVSVNGNIEYSDVIKITWGAHNVPQVFPNPAGSSFTITAGLETIRDITIFDATGKLVQRIINNNGMSVFTVNSSVMASGVYVVKITTTAQVYEQKLFKH
jgi:hypothetical protein